MLGVKEQLPKIDGVDSTPANASAEPWHKRPWRFPRTWADVKKLGWRFILAFVLFYLIRDTILYIIIPYLVYKGIISL